MTGAPSQAVSASGVPLQNVIPLGYQQITSLAAAQTPTVPAGANVMIVSAETQAVRFRSDGVTPTATVGFPLAVGVQLVFRMSNAALGAIKFIEQTASAKLNIEYYADQ